MTSKKKKTKKTKITTKSTKKKDIVENQYPVSAIMVPKTRHIKPESYSLSRVGLEIYKTDEDNYEPYTPNGNTATQEEDTTEEEDNELKGFTLHMGEVYETAHYSRIKSLSFESDYTDMSDSGSIKLPNVDLNRFYKGVRVKLLSEWESSSKILSWENLQDALLGFITEQTFSGEGVELKISGMTKTLDQKYNFEFKGMRRSEILAEIILTAGLIPSINVDGLDDDVTDFSNSSSDKKSDSSGTDSESSGSASIDEAVKKAIEGKSDDLGKAEAIDSAFKSHVYYKYYWNCHFSDIDKAWKDAHLNCADGANVLCAMFRAGGLNAVIVHTTGHYIVKIKVGGKTYYTDNAANSGNHTTRKFGEVWRGITSGSEVGTKISM